MIRRSVVVLMLLLAAMGARAQEMLTRQVGLAEITDRSAFILHGRILECVQERHAQYPNITVRKVTMRVLASMRGVPPERVFTFREYVESPRMRHLGKTEAVGRSKVLDRTYRPGEEVVLFLHGESKYGLTSSVGAKQGTFRVSRNRAGQAWAANGVNNAGLFQDVSVAAQQSGLKLSAAEQALVAKNTGPAEFKTFLSLVSRLAARRAK